MDRVFDCLEEFDERSKDHPIAPYMTGPGRSYTWGLSKILDQGSQGACAAFMGGHELIAQPVPIRQVGSKFCLKLYNAARKIDVYPGHKHPGTSILAVCKMLKQWGFISGYKWGFGEPDLRAGLSGGPAGIGITWMGGMERPNKHGIIRATGRPTGRHAVLVNGYNYKRGLYTIANSWGRRWGKNGLCHMSDEDMAKSLAMRGEAVFFQGRKYGNL